MKKPEVSESTTNETAAKNSIANDCAQTRLSKKSKGPSKLSLFLVMQFANSFAHLPMVGPKTLLIN